jgi:protein-disulfide isomerase
MENNQPSSYLLPVSILIAAVLVAGALVYNAGVRSTGGADSGGPVANVLKILEAEAADRVVLGDAKAPVTVYEFGDFQCPFCGKFHKETGGQIREEYIKTGKVKMIFIDLAFLGPESVQAAQAAHCAGDQGKYWAYHDFLYNHLWDNYFAQNKNGENVGAFSNDNLKSFAKTLGLDAAKFNECLDSGKFADKVDAGRQAAEATLGQRLSTPSIFVQDQLIQGAQPYAVFKDAIEKALD